MTEKGTLEENEPHPATALALKFIRSLPIQELIAHLEALSSVAIGNNRLAEICAETLRRFLHGEPVSDRYFLGLAWLIKVIKEEGIDPKNCIKKNNISIFTMGVAPKNDKNN